MYICKYNIIAHFKHVLVSHVHDFKCFSSYYHVFQFSHKFGLIVLSNKVEVYFTLLIVITNRRNIELFLTKIIL